jgi:hypothetical protein
MYGLMGAAGNGVESRYRVGSLESGALLCRAYEAYLDLHALQSRRPAAADALSLEAGRMAY